MSCAALGHRGWENNINICQWWPHPQIYIPTYVRDLGDTNKGLTENYSN